MDYERIRTLAKDLGELVEEKNRAYGDSAATSGKIMALLYPGGIQPEQMSAALLVVRILDKLSRIATDPSYGNEAPWQDIAGYGLIGQEMFSSCATEPETNHNCAINEPGGVDDPGFPTDHILKGLKFCASHPIPWTGECGIAGCKSTVEGEFGMCWGHYQQWCRLPKSIADEPVVEDTIEELHAMSGRWDGSCSVPGCDSTVKGSFGLCRKHYQRLWKTQRERNKRILETAEARRAEAVEREAADDFPFVRPSPGPSPREAPLTRTPNHTVDISG